MDDALTWLRRVPAFAAADDALLRRAAARSVVRRFPNDALVVRSGAPLTDVLIVVQGELHLYRQNREARTQILVAVVHAPATFGDAELYGRAPWMVSARSLADTVVVAMPAAAFDDLVEHDAKVAATLYRETCGRLLLAVQVMQVHTLQKVKHKILRLLWDKLERAGGVAASRTTELSVVELASALGVNRKTITRNLRELEDDSILRRDGARVEVLISPDALPLRPFSPTAPNADWKLPERG